MDAQIWAMNLDLRSPNPNSLFGLLKKIGIWILGQIQSEFETCKSVDLKILANLPTYHFFSILPQAAITFKPKPHWHWSLSLSTILILLNLCINGIVWVCLWVLYFLWAVSCLWLSLQFFFLVCIWVVWVSFGFVYLGLYLLVKLGLGNGNALEIFIFFGII